MSKLPPAAVAQIIGTEHREQPPAAVPDAVVAGKGV